MAIDEEKYAAPTVGRCVLQSDGRQFSVFYQLIVITIQYRKTGIGEKHLCMAAAHRTQGNDRG